MQQTLPINVFEQRLREPVSPRLSIWLDALRWIAAAVVFQSHLRALLFADYDPRINSSLFERIYYFTTGFGHQAVVVFFVLSGYLVGGEVVRKVMLHNFSWPDYLIRRAARLYSVYVVALLLGMCFDWTGGAVFASTGIYDGQFRFPALDYAVTDRLSLDVLLGNLLFLQGILVPTFGSNEPLWSLANEAWYYLLFPLCLCPVFMGRRTPVRAAILVCLAFLVMWLTRGKILLWFAVWLLGLLPLFLRLRVPAVLLMLGVLGILVITRLGWLHGIGLWGCDILLGMMVALLLAALRTVGSAGIPAGWSVRLHQWLAGFSYSLYLVHWPFVLFCAAWLQFLGFDTLRQPFHYSHLLLVMLLTLAGYAFCFAVATQTEHRTAGARLWLTRLLRR